MYHLQNTASKSNADARSSRRFRIVLIAMTAVCTLVFISILLPSRNNGGHSPRVKCASNLKQIYNACVLYANANTDSLPPDFATILLTQDVDSYVFVCPSTNHSAATGPTPQAIAAKLTGPPNCSYIYLGNGKSLSTLHVDEVIAYEPVTNHDGDGANVLFGDGRVNFCTPKELAVALAGPASKPSTQPTSTGMLQVQ